MKTKNEYTVFEGFDHFNNKPLYQVIGTNNDYSGEWHTRKSGAVDPDRSVNCYFCASLVDERDCIGADGYNNNDGGSICKSCVRAVRTSEVT